MEITEVRIKLIDNTEDRLRGFCSITFDDMFVVRDLKIIEGNKGPFVAMPSRKLTTNCHKCRSKNHLRARFCNQCGTRFREQRIEHDSGGRAKLYADVAHPVNARCREMIQNRVIEELNKEIKRSQQPGYSSKYDDDYFDDDPGPAIDIVQVPAVEADEPKKEPPSSGELPAQVNDSTEKTTRVDAGTDNPNSPHNPEEGIREAPKSRDDEFGKGIFE